jgi:hypothetical protein
MHPAIIGNSNGQYIFEKCDYRKTGYVFGAKVKRKE